MSMDNDNFDFMSELNDIHEKNLKEKSAMQKPDSNSMFEFEDDVVDDEPVQRTVKVISDTKKKYTTNTPVRSQEDYEEWVDSVHYETMTHTDGTQYEVKVTLLKPGANPLENMKPAYAYASNF